ncbi:MAG: pyrroline-5-carboxylate reductase [Dysgonamonadaceae bacterium]|jgi:pyrroline-5-carboxylate reductase|nr:pyrroline-5-carboxylate reductase [Dysgonamonadaceae bacterium]
MKLTIIGGGNMGSAIVRGLLQGSIFKPEDITVSDIHTEPLEALKKINPALNTVLRNYNGICDSDIILLAVKPWLISDVIDDIKFQMDYGKQILVSIAAGVTVESIEKYLAKRTDEFTLPTIFRIIPNTAVAVRQSMTLIASHNASSEQEELLLKIFNELGNAILLDESKIAAGTALTSCGIAYLFRYVRAAMLAGVEMGFYPKEAQDMVVNTMLGAAELLKATGQNPETEIDKVTTPGGITIKGLNELEANGFSDAIIKAMKISKV